MPERVPPGRAGRMWLSGRIAFARRAAELLDRKRQLLRRDLIVFASQREESKQKWEAACLAAEHWGLRAAVISGESDLAATAAAVAGQASVEVSWRNSMGVIHASDTRFVPAHLSPIEEAAANAAVPPAAAAYGLALQAAVVHAAMDNSFRILSAELRAIEGKLRAIERHRLPALENARRELELRLDELEREERVVTRWAERHREDLVAGPASTSGRAQREGK